MHQHVVGAGGIPGVVGFIGCPVAIAAGFTGAPLPDALHRKIVEADVGVEAVVAEAAQQPGIFSGVVDRCKVAAKPNGIGFPLIPAGGIHQHIGRTASAQEGRFGDARCGIEVPREISPVATWVGIGAGAAIGQELGEVGSEAIGHPAVVIGLGIGPTQEGDR